MQSTPGVTISMEYTMDHHKSDSLYGAHHGPPIHSSLSYNRGYFIRCIRELVLWDLKCDFRHIFSFSAQKCARKVYF